MFNVLTLRALIFRSWSRLHTCSHFLLTVITITDVKSANSYTYEYEKITLRTKVISSSNYELLKTGLGKPRGRYFVRLT